MCEGTLGLFPNEFVYYEQSLLMKTVDNSDEESIAVNSSDYCNLYFCAQNVKINIFINRFKFLI